MGLIVLDESGVITSRDSASRRLFSAELPSGKHFDELSLFALTATELIPLGFVRLRGMIEGGQFETLLCFQNRGDEEVLCLALDAVAMQKDTVGIGLALAFQLISPSFMNQDDLESAVGQGAEIAPVLRIPGLNLGKNGFQPKATASLHPYLIKLLRFRRQSDLQTLIWRSAQSSCLKSMNKELHKAPSNDANTATHDDRFLQLAENISEVFWVWDLEQKNFIYLSPACEKVYGFGREAVIAEPGLILKAVYHEDQLILHESLERQYLGEETYAEYRNVRQGDIIWVSVKSFPIKDNNGRCYRVAGITADISERKAYEEALQKAKEVAEAANRAKTAFLANMSHEIRTPLGAILGFTELLRQESLEPAERLSFIQTIIRNGRDLTRLIDDILDISKVEAGRIEIEKIAVSLPGLIAEIAQSLSVSAKEKGISLCFTSEGLIPKTIVSDPTRIRQILLNIIGNAIKFTSQGGVSVKIKYKQRESLEIGTLVEFIIEDSGQGIASDNTVTLFQAFSQADSSTTRTFGGTGLGLALSRRLARLLGGDVVLAQSSPGQGSTFIVSIDGGPLQAQQLLCQLGERSADADAVVPKRGNLLAGVQVLYAEDSIDNQLLLTHILLRYGATVEIAHNGAEAVEKALSQDFDIILMDIQMPVLDGYGATAQLRQQGYDRPIIALTAHAMRDDRERSLQQGCDDHLSKPIQISQLIKLVAQYTQREPSIDKLPQTGGV